MSPVSLVIQGPQGQTGPQGPQGETGPQGPTAAAVGAIIPFASGPDVVLATEATGIPGLGTVVAFGSSAPNIAISGAINLLGIPNEAFIVPRSGTITSLSASLTVISGSPGGSGTFVVRAQIYTNGGSGDVFTPTAAFVDLPAFGLPVSVGTFVSGTSAPLAVPVAVGTRLVLVIQGTNLGIVDPAPQLVSGALSAGLNFV